MTGPELEKLRYDARLSRRALAEALGVSQGRIFDVERRLKGQRSPEFCERWTAAIKLSQGRNVGVGGIGNQKIYYSEVQNPDSWQPSVIIEAAQTPERPATEATKATEEVCPRCGKLKKDCTRH